MLNRIAPIDRPKIDKRCFKCKTAEDLRYISGLEKYFCACCWEQIQSENIRERETEKQNNEEE